MQLHQEKSCGGSGMIPGCPYEICEEHRDGTETCPADDLLDKALSLFDNGNYNGQTVRKMLEGLREV